MTANELEQHTSRRLDVLRRELAEVAAPGEVAAVGQYHLERLARHATVTDYIPLLVYRSTKEELLGVRPIEFDCAA